MDSSKLDHSFFSWIFDQSGIIIAAIGCFIVWWRLILPRQDRIAKEKEAARKEAETIEREAVRTREKELIEGLKTSISGSITEPITQLKEVVEKQGKDFASDRRKNQDRSEEYASRLFGSLASIEGKLVTIDNDVRGLKDKVANIDGRVTDLEKRK